MSGIEAKNYEKAVEIIKEQMLCDKTESFLKKKYIKQKCHPKSNIRGN